MAKKQQIILTHGSGMPSENVLKELKLGEILVQHASDSKEAALHTVRTEGNAESLVSFPSKDYVDAQIAGLKITDVNDTLTSLQTQINDEKTARKNADTKIREDFTSADTKIREDFVAADTALKNAYEAADAELDGKIAANTANIKTNTDAISAITADYLKGEDKTELEGKITSAETNAKSYTDQEVSALATGAVANNTAEISAIKKDYLKASDKTELNNAITAETAARQSADTEIKEIIGYTDKNAVKNAIEANASAITENANAISSINSTISKLDETYATDAQLSSKVTELEGKITAAQNAATTKVVEGTDGNENLSISSATDDNGAVTYTINLTNVAKADELSGLNTKVTTLIDKDANKSVRTIANEELAKQLIPEGAQESLDTLQEIAAWIQAHPKDAADMNTAISNNATAITANAQAIETEKNARESADTQIRTDFAAADATTLSSAKTYTDTTVSALENGAVKTNADNIAKNTSAITQNTTAIETNKTAIENEVKARKEAITGVTAMIEALDATVGSASVASDKHVAVQVVQADGKLTGLTVTESDIASASDLTALTNRVTSAETKLTTIQGEGDGSIKKALADAKIYADDKVKGLNATAGTTTVATGKHVAVQVIEKEGKVTGVTVTENDIASAATVSGIDTRLNTVEGKYITAATITNTATNKITATAANNVITFNFDNMVIDGGTY